MHKILLTLGSLLFLALPLFAQNVGGMWTEVSLEKDLSRRLSAEFSLGQRQEEDFRRATRWNTSLSFDYKLNRTFRIGAGYTYIYDYNAEEATPRYKKGALSGYNVDAPFWRTKHRFVFDFGARHRFNRRWNIHLRERLQLTRNLTTTTTEYKYRTVAPDDFTGTVYPYNGTNFRYLTSETDEKRAKTRLYLRHRIGIDYNIKGLPLEPFATYEMTNDTKNAFNVVRHRASLGTKWKITKQHVLTLGYLYQRGEMDQGTTGNFHILNLGYKFKF